MNPSISYCVTACTELQELKRLLPRLIEYYVPTEDEIIIQLDTSRSEEVYQYCKMLEKDGVNIKVIEFPLNNDFAAFKNNLIAHCTKEWQFQLDADELPHDTLLIILKEILYNNDEVDLFYLPRINVVPNIESRLDLVTKWGWVLSGTDNRVNNPDYQGRIFRNQEGIRWAGAVHERITGHCKHSQLPIVDDYSIIHVKSLEKQIKQNDYYESII